MLAHSTNSRSRYLSIHSRALSIPRALVLFLTCTLFVSALISSGCSGITSAKGSSTTTNTASLSINTPALPNAITQTAYTGALSATGGITPYTWSITSGSLPPGLNLNSSSGAITGTPTTAGTFSFTAQAKDSSPTPQAATASASVLTVNLLQITTTSLPDPQVQTSYSATLTASGGMLPYVWSISSGSLPPGLSLDSSTGVISGVPTSTGSYAFTVEVSDPPSVPQKSQKYLHATVQAKTLQITTSGLPNGQVQVAYSATLAASGGTTPYSWAISLGSLPAGLSLNLSTGAISGTPTQSGTFSSTAQVTDSVSLTAQQALNITVNAAAVAPSITTQPASQTLIAGQTATLSVTATGTSPLTYQWNKNGTAISGATSSTYTTPATTSSDNGAQFTVTISNSVGTVTSTAATLTVNTPPSITTQPPSQTVTVGQTAGFSVAAMGTAPLGYQWNKNGTAIGGATGASYTTPATTSSDNGAQFTVTVNNSAGTVTSNAATLTVNTPPSITAQPTSQTVTAGQTATFSVTASGTAPLSYQWRKNAAAISGATSSSYTTPATTSSDTGAQFTVTISNSVGTVTSTAATLTVNTPPSITTQPVSQTVTSGQTASFSVAAMGTAPLTYQWNKNGTAISGATAASYTTPAITSSDNGAQFTVTVSNSAGTVTSNAATLTVNTPPSITTQPVSQTVIVSQTASFSVAATGTAPLTYQWNKNGTAISGATSSTYTTPATTSSDNGAQFTVIISNSVGTVTSNAATLTVNTPPSISAQPISQTATAGQTASFSVTASGTSPLSYQWNKNGTAIGGATSSSYTTPVTTTADNGAQFTVTVSNSAGSVTSSAATLTVNVAPSITTQPASQTVTVGQTATFSVTASGTTPFSYQWQKNGVAISGATSANYTTPATSSSDTGAQFTVTISNSAGSATSNAATLTVNAAAVAPSISTQPASQTVPAGQTATFSVTATGTAPLSYQWQKNGTAVSGATSSTYTTPATTTSGSGTQFTVTVSNSAGSATSNAATLTVTSYVLTATPSSFSLSAQAGGAVLTQTVSINDTTPGPLPFTLSTDKSWITLSATSGTTQSGGTPMQFSVNPSGLAAGTYSGNIFVTASGVTNSPLAIPVTLAVSPAVAPSITTQPLSQTVTAGQTATFAVVATGTSPLTYQWQKNGTTISGAASLSYTTPATISSDNGTQFTVTVSNSAGSATSNAATLTVNAATPGALAPSTTSLSFGNVIVSSNSVLGVNFTNSGSVNITVSNVTISGAGFTASGVSNGQIITPGQVVTLNVTFAPAATGSTTGNVTVASNASNSPTSISLSGSGVLAHSATLSWTASTSTVIGYNVYRGPVSGGPYTLVNSSLVAGTQYVDSTVLAGQIYYYVATAVASGNVESTYSNQVSATIPTP